MYFAHPISAYEGNEYRLIATKKTESVISTIGNSEISNLLHVFY